MESTNQRNLKIKEWINAAVKQNILSIDGMAHDASCRRYYRVRTDSGSYVAMDAPPPLENCQPFVAIAHALRDMGLEAPEIFAQNIEDGFLLLTDFGDTTILQMLKQEYSTSLADQLYVPALRALAVMQNCQVVKGHELMPFGREWLQREWVWHKEWFLDKWLGLSYGSDERVLDACYELLIQSAVEQPQVFMHRDFHSANLMPLPKNMVGILDFQDAFVGPLTYDPVSLLRDCYISWPDNKVTEWALLYASMLRERGVLCSVTDGEYMRWFDLMGVQRHLKALLTFARKFVRDQQPGYLQHIPRTLNYIVTVSRKYPELQPLAEFYDSIVERANKEALCEA